MKKSKKLSPEEFMQFNREVLALIKSGIPVPEAMKKMARELQGGRLRNTFEEVSESLLKGKSLAESVKNSRHCFGDYYCSLISAGEASGSMEYVLQQALKSSRNKCRFYKSLKIATMYPMLLGIAFTAVTIIVTLFLTPKLENLYSQAPEKIPFLTSILFLLRTVITGKSVFPLIITIIAVYLSVSWWISNTKKGQYLREVIFISLPMTSQMLCFHIMENFSRSLGNMLSSDVPIEEALVLTQENINSPVFSPVIDKILDAVRKGNKISSALEDVKSLPDTMKWMISLSEERGDLDQSLLDLADLYAEKRDFAFLQFVTLAQPVLTIIAGIFICLLLAAVYLPYLTISQFAM
jgi:type II secretory pathway component PulF